MSNRKGNSSRPVRSSEGCANPRRQPVCTKWKHLHHFTPRDLAQIAHSFARTRSKNDEMAFYRHQESFAAALRAAALCETARPGKMHDHQWRIGRKVVAKAHKRLQSLNLERCEIFHDLYSAIRDRLQDERRVGGLYFYDVAQRVGAFLGLQPDYVYLHAGTRRGARALGLPASGEYLTKDELPTQLRSMGAALVEDFFCITKDCLRPSMLGDWKPRAPQPR